MAPPGLVLTIPTWERLTSPPAGPSSPTSGFHRNSLFEGGRQVSLVAVYRSSVYHAEPHSSFYGAREDRFEWSESPEEVQALFKKLAKNHKKHGNLKSIDENNLALLAFTATYNLRAAAAELLPQGIIMPWDPYIIDPHHPWMDTKFLTSPPQPKLNKGLLISISAITAILGFLRYEGITHPCPQSTEKLGFPLSSLVEWGNQLTQLEFEVLGGGPECSNTSGHQDLER